MMIGSARALGRDAKGCGAPRNRRRVGHATVSWRTGVVLLTAIIRTLPAEAVAGIARSIRTTTEVARTTLLDTSISRRTLDGFECDVNPTLGLLMAHELLSPGPAPEQPSPATDLTSPH